MRIAVLCSPEAWHFRDLKRAAGDRHELQSFRFEDLTARIAEQSTFNLSADCVIVRTMPPGSLQQIVFRMDLLGQMARSGVMVLNPPRSIEAAVDKYLSLALLQASGVPVPQTMVSQTVAAGLRHFEKLGSDVVVKPLFGSLGNGIVRIRSATEAATHFQKAVDEGQVVYQQSFIDHGGCDIRLLVIGEQVLGMKRINCGHWITNISQGGTGQPYSPTQFETELAIRAARSLGAHFAGVDLLYDANKNPFVVEVNAVPGWQAISKVLQIDIASQVLAEIESGI
jgi:RimK family alpha-L-glutamate ligase